MKLHDLRPAPGSHTKRTRVGRGIAAGGGKTAGRGTKGQKARAGGSIPPWFEGGQTPLHQRIPKLRGFKNPFKTQYEIVNLGRIAALVELGALEAGELPGAKKPAAEGTKTRPAPITVNQEILRAVGAVRTLDKPLKILGQGELETALFVVADAFSKTAVAKIEAAGGSVQVLEVPTRPRTALGVEPATEPAAPSTKAKGTPAARPTAIAEDADAAAEGVAERKATKVARGPRAASAKAEPTAARTGPKGSKAERSAPKADRNEAKAEPSEAKSGRSDRVDSKAGTAEPAETEPAEPDAEPAGASEPDETATAVTAEAGEPEAPSTEPTTGEDD
jgi:large subunit ribosomal protein L15